MSGELDPDAVWRDAWAQLARATRDRRHAFRHPVVATHAPGHGVRARTVVLRRAEPSPARLTLFTDRRSGKLEALGAEPFLSWCFYDRRSRIQLRIETRADVHVGDAVAREAWASQGPAARAVYAVEPAPATPLGPEVRPPDQAEADAGFTHFAVVVGAVEEVDWLQLGRTEHRRIRFCAADGVWRGVPVVP